MGHFVFEIADKHGKNTGTFLSTRKPTGKSYPDCYTARVTISDFEHAKIFNTRAAAKNSAKHAKLNGRVWAIRKEIDYHSPDNNPYPELITAA